MLRLRSRVPSHILSSPSTSPGPPLRRLLSAAAPVLFPNPGFVVEDYLVSTCGLTRAQSIKASAKLSHLKSPAKPDAVLAFLVGLGLSGDDVAAVVAKDPKFLCSGVERTLAPVVAGLSGLGLSRSEVALLVSLAPDNFRCRPIVSKLRYCLPLFGSSENLLRAARHDASILSLRPERTAKPNIAFLQECGLSACDIAKLCGCVPRLLITNLERVREMVTLADGLGVPRGSGMFRHALQAVAFFSDKKMAATVDQLKKTLRWSDAEVRIALPKAPFVLRKPKESLQRRSEFLISEVGFEPAYIAHRPIMLCYSIEGRLRPRYYVVKFLKENGLLKRNPSYFTIFKMGEKLFVEKYICPHKEAAPYLVEDYADACRGEVPSRLMSA
ncbi:hypothetical protein D1007_53071 [Hordeum vulgare]|uniref:Uncharacterized protein n=1 Tax=Hordeum vulgare subsp. vulgare TaxID=112509 RepID=M0WK00_HORVV|nr:transcription termination factor MTERF15, mitochondrial-like [Hordeum vulgare subsp. vulgare]KAE8774546.1 hypothetical protein D1007_53071 [Hordeum vulgare]